MAKQTEAQIKFKADITGFQSSITEMNNGIGVLNSQLRLNSTQLKDNADSVELLQKRSELLNTAYNDSKAKVEATEKALQVAKSVFGENSTETQQWEKKLAAAQTQEESLRQSVEQNNTALQQAKEKATGASQADEDLANSEKKADKNSQEANVSFLANVEALNKVGQVAKEAGDKVLSFGKSTVDAEKKFDDATDAMQYGTGRSNAEMENLNNTFNNIVKTIPVKDLKDLSGAITVLAQKTNASDSEIDGFATNIAKLSDKSGESATVIANTAIAISNQFGTSIDESLNLMMNANQKFGVSFSDLGNMASTAGAALHNELGLSVEQVTGLMGTFSASGLDASSAVTGLLKATKNMSKDGTASVEGLNNVLKGLSDGTISTADATDIFGAKATNMISFLKEKGITNINDFASALKGQSGSLQTVSEMYDGMVDSNDAATVAQQNADKAMSDLGTTAMVTLTPAIENVTGMIQGFSNWWTSLDSNTQSIIVTVGEVIVVLGILGGALSTLQSTMFAIQILTATNPAILIIAAIVAIIAAIVLLWNNCEWFRNMITGSWETIKNVWNGVPRFFGGIWDAVSAPVSGIWNDIEGTFSDALEWIQGLFNFQWHWPSIPLPHFSISGSWNPIDWLSEGVPSIGVEWYAKAMNKPFIADSPSIIGIGEAGSEMVVGTDFLTNRINEAIQSVNNNGLSDSIMALANRPIVLSINGNRFAEATAGDADHVSGTRINLSSRGLAI